MEFNKANLKAKKEKIKVNAYKITTNMATKFNLNNIKGKSVHKNCF
jgi:hypothetical protein